MLKFTIRSGVLDGPEGHHNEPSDRWLNLNQRESIFVPMVLYECSKEGSTHGKNCIFATLSFISYQHILYLLYKIDIQCFRNTLFGAFNKILQFHVHVDNIDLTSHGWINREQITILLWGDSSKMEKVWSNQVKFIVVAFNHSTT